MDPDPEVISDLMFSNFSEVDAMKVAVRILRMIGCYRGVLSLGLRFGVRKSSSKADPESPSSLAFLLSSSETDPKSRSSSAAYYMDQYKDHEMYDVSDVEQILDELLTKGVIDQNDYDRISALQTLTVKIRGLLDHLAAVESQDILYDMLIQRRKQDLQGPRQSGSDYQQEEAAMHVSRKIITGSKMSPEGDWIQLEPEVNCVDAEDAPIYSLQSEAGNFECRVSGLRWVCKEKVSFKYQFGSWVEHMEKLETLSYIPCGPLLDITVTAGMLDEAHLPHWICTEDNPAILDAFSVLHIDTCGDAVEKVSVSEVTPSHVKLSKPVFSPRGTLMRAGFPVKIHCKVLIYKTNKTFLTLHVYLIPRDPALQQNINNKASSSGYRLIQKPYPEKALKMRRRFTLTSDKELAEISPKNLKLIYDDKDPNYFEVFIKNPGSPFQLMITQCEVCEPVWDGVIREDDYQNPGDIRVKFDEELGRVRCELVRKMTRELINQLLDDLSQDGVLNDGERSSITEENSIIADRARCLIDMVRKKGNEASRMIFTHLKSRDPTLFAELGLPSGLPV